MRAFGSVALLAFGTGGAILSFLVVYAWITQIPTVREP